MTDVIEHDPTTDELSNDEWNLAVARDLAYEMHKTQKDKNGNPYREHLLGVYRGVVVLGGSVHAQQAAFLHDIIEDTSITAKQLREDHGFDDRVVSAVQAVTKVPNEKQEDYLDRIILAGEDAMIVKLADLLHNTHPERLADLPTYTKDRLHKKYRPAIARLLLELGRIVDEDTQKKLATVPQGTSFGTYASDPSYMKVDDLCIGDWIVGAPAPIKNLNYSEELGDFYELGDGSFAALKYGATTWRVSKVAEKLKKDPTWAPTVKYSSPNLTLADTLENLTALLLAKAKTSSAWTPGAKKDEKKAPDKKADKPKQGVLKDLSLEEFAYLGIVEDHVGSPTNTGILCDCDERFTSRADHNIHLARILAKEAP